MNPQDYASYRASLEQQYDPFSYQLVGVEEHGFAWLLVVVCYLVCLAPPLLREKPLLLFTAWTCVTIRTLFAYVDCFVTDLNRQFMIAPDALTFHASALGLDTGYHDYSDIPYRNALKFVYDNLGNSKFVGEMTSVFASTLFFIIVLHIASLFEWENYSVPILLLLAILPGYLTFNTFTMRETWQTLSMALSLYSAIKARRERDWRWALLFLFSCFCLFSLHRGLKYYAVLLMLFTPVWFFAKRELLIAFFMIFGFSMLFFNFNKLIPKKNIHRIADYRQNVEESRTSYDHTINAKNITTFSYSLIPVVYSYFCLPTPNKIVSIADVLAASENILRLICIFFALTYLSSLPRSPRRHELLYMMFACLLLEVLWSIGTSNWGTAYRHHLPASWCFYLIGISAIEEKLLSKKIQQISEEKTPEKQLKFAPARTTTNWRKKQDDRLPKGGPA